MIEKMKPHVSLSVRFFSTFLGVFCAFVAYGVSVPTSVSAEDTVWCLIGGAASIGNYTNHQTWEQCKASGGVPSLGSEEVYCMTWSGYQMMTRDECLSGDPKPGAPAVTCSTSCNTATANTFGGCVAHNDQCKQQGGFFFQSGTTQYSCLMYEWRVNKCADVNKWASIDTSIRCPTLGTSITIQQYDEYCVAAGGYNARAFGNPGSSCYVTNSSQCPTQYGPGQAPAGGSSGTPTGGGGTSNTPSTPTSNPTNGNNGNTNSGGTSAFNNPLKMDSIESLVLAIIDVVLIFLLPVIILYIMYAGFLFVKANGNPEGISQAKKALLTALIGGVIVVGARAILDVVKGTVESVVGEGTVSE